MHKAKNTDTNSKTHDRPNKSEMKNYELQNILDDHNEEHLDLIPIHRASKVLRCIYNGVNTLSDIADYSNISKSATHRLLKAMEKSHFITFSPFSHRYFLGDLIISAGLMPDINHEYLAITAKTEIEELASLTEEGVTLGVLAGLRQVCVRFIPSTHNLRLVAESHEASSIFSGGLAYALLSQLKDADLKLFLRNIKMVPLTEYTITDKEALLSRIGEARKAGYAITSNERIMGGMCLAAPVRNYILPAAVAILGPETRMKERTSSFLKLLTDITNRISFNLLNRFN